MLIFFYQFNWAKMHSKKSLSRFFCKLSAPIPNEQTLFGTNIKLLTSYAKRIKVITSFQYDY